MYSRRVFSNINDDINFSDYNSLLAGNEIYKNIQSKGSFVYDNNYTIQNHCLTNISDYDTYLNLNRTHFRYFAPKNNTYDSPSSINEAKTSYICYNQYISPCNNYDDIYRCKENKNILYPYGNYVNKINYSNCQTKNFAFPVKIKFNTKCHRGCNIGCERECNDCCKKECNDNCCEKKCNDCCVKNTNNGCGKTPLFVSKKCKSC